MDQILHGGGATTEAVRRAMRASKEGGRALVRRQPDDGANAAQAGPHRRRGDGPQAAALRRLEREGRGRGVPPPTPLPLNDCLYALQPSLPHPARPSLNRRPLRHRIARLPDTDGDRPERSRCQGHTVDVFHTAIAEAHAGAGRLHLVVAVTGRPRFALARPHETATRRVATDILRAFVAAAPCRIHTVPTDIGTRSVDRTPIDEMHQAAAAA